MIFHCCTILLGTSGCYNAGKNLTHIPKHKKYAQIHPSFCVQFGVMSSNINNASQCVKNHGGLTYSSSVTDSVCAEETASFSLTDGVSAAPALRSLNASV